MKIKELLLALNSRWPISGHQNHNITFDKASQRVRLNIYLNGEWQSIFVDDEDFEKPAADLVAEISTVLSRKLA